MEAILNLMLKVVESKDHFREVHHTPSWLCNITGRCHIGRTFVYSLCETLFGLMISQELGLTPFVNGIKAEEKQKDITGVRDESDL